MRSYCLFHILEPLRHATLSGSCSTLDYHPSTDFSCHAILVFQKLLN